MSQVLLEVGFEKILSPHDAVNTKTQNGYAILCFENPYWVWFLIPKSVATLLGIGIKSSFKRDATLCLASLFGLLLG
jgi:hypothetical protein